ncbi:T9SS type A sorting domain-containing protein [Psychroflexus aestuariivivens]|uniref:T9SS type A sorting domain-containing protein n=1 Tax=Psychroflexus aestuariivivens TaxID=1795040 RepID=UPI000FDA5CFC|nr:T9SS type A sorting domain-containing protein [Psychroflexus aestuariivivens]
MKQKLLLFALLFGGFFVNAQIADGSVAPDFTATDINGNSHTLSSYLADGKTVILNVSATWCGPCWNYKQTGALKDIHYSYGSEGSDEVVILYIEGDASTGLAELNGTGNTVGNWVESTPFPIIDNATIANQYQINYFPTVYRICPDGLVYEMGQLSNSNIENHINANCSGTLAGVQNHASIETDEVSLCDDNTNADINLNIRNYGENAITSITFELDNGSSATQITESVNIGKWQDASITVSSLIDSNNNYEVSILNVNGNAANNSSISTSDVEVSASSQVLNDIEVHILTDNYPGEISWNLRDESDQIVASGGPYQAGTDDQWGGGGPDANTTKVHQVTLAESIECYSLELLDSFGDGWSISSTPNGAQIHFDNEVKYEKIVGNFGSSLLLSKVIKQVDELSTTENNLVEFSLYPNPAKDVVNFKAQDQFDIEIFNIEGKRVFVSKAMEANSQINLSDLSKGLYLVKITSNNLTQTEKLILN